MLFKLSQAAFTACDSGLDTVPVGLNVQISKKCGSILPHFRYLYEQISIKTEKPLSNSDQSPRRMRIPRGVTTVTVPVNLFKSKFVKTRSNITFDRTLTIA